MSEAPQPTRQLPLWGLVIALLLGVWLGQAPGILSSNDGSHVALARAFGVRAETRVDPDAWMTLGVDLARRDGAWYSDRPPGTAAAAVVAARVGSALDGPFAKASAEARDWVWAPWSDLFEHTKQARAPGAPAGAFFQGTAWSINLHAALIAALGLWALARIAERIGAARNQVIEIVCIVGLATAYGGYASTLFSHVSATAFVLLAVDQALVAREDTGARAPVLAGLFGAWAIACDYSFVLVSVPLIACTLPLGRWPLAFAGALLPAALVAAYHQRAFGSVWAIGYDFNIRFEFARERGTTFGGNTLQGLWSLLGAGNWSGWLSRSPVLWIGLVFALRNDHESPWTRRWLLALLPWTLLIASHQTPTGGAGEDYRYLIALVPFAALGITRMPRHPPLLALTGAAFAFSVASWWYWFQTRFELSVWPHPLTTLVVFSICALIYLASRSRLR